VLLMLTPWDRLLAQLQAGGDTYGNSPFVLVFSGMGASLAAHVLNFVILTATLSVYNSMVYCTSRLLYGMALEGNAPAALTRVNRRGVPVRAIVWPGLVTALCVVLNYVAPAGVIELLLSLVVAALVITWVTIIVTHLRFSRGAPPARHEARLSCAAVAADERAVPGLHGLVVVVMLLTPSIRSSALAIPVWCWRSTRRTGSCMGAGAGPRRRPDAKVQAGAPHRLPQGTSLSQFDMRIAQNALAHPFLVVGKRTGLP
jgi:L-asparagine transporter-like permease